MIPLYKAQTFERIIEKGGRNKPWIISVETPVGLEPYVVKLFSEQDIQNQNAICREVYGATFARELDLNTPDFCLVEFTDHFYDSLPVNLKEIYEEKHTRYAFGSYYLEGAPTYSPSLHYNELSDYEIESIYAFDIVVRNVDRRIGTPPKPNILLYEKEAYLIDHEHCFALTINDTPKNRSWDISTSQTHISFSIKEKNEKSPE